VFPIQNYHGLPKPEPAALAHSERLRERIRTVIDAAGGAIAFSRYMQMALFEPGLGYYSAGAVKFGAEGDFITAVDQGDFLARAIVATLMPRLAAYDSPVIVELGAGTGKLADDILRLLDERGLDRVAYRILEPSADLRARQLRSLAARRTRVEWIDRLDPACCSGAIIANEVVDALPVDRITRTRSGWQQLAVALEGEKFCWHAKPLDATQQACIDSICARLSEPLPEGFTTEIRPLLPAWIRSLCAALVGGDILLVDYGFSRREYFHPQRDAGTLMCHYRHRAHGNPFLFPGLQDITAWVDFSDCGDAARAAGMQLAGYATQGSWIAEALQDDPLLAEGLDFTQAASLRTLLLPGEMGERFKALLLSTDPAAALCGRDLRARL
jgi:SAM-dependent MidA family methyltransferase